MNINFCAFKATFISVTKITSFTVTEWHLWFQIMLQNLPRIYPTFNYDLNINVFYVVSGCILQRLSQSPTFCVVQEMLRAELKQHTQKLKYLGRQKRRTFLDLILWFLHSWTNKNNTGINLSIMVILGVLTTIWSNNLVILSQV